MYSRNPTRSLFRPKPSAVFVAFALLATANPPVAHAQSWPGGVIHFDTVPAPSLRKNLLGDPDRRAVSIYTPPGYTKNSRGRYPVVYLLHGFAADHRAFIAGVYTGMNTRMSMDSLINAGLIKPMIVVTPNARNAFDGSFYTNSVTTGNWEDFIVKDLVSYVDSHYRTIRSRTGRGLAGHSMGGFGTLRVGMKHPDVFSAMYALSPCCLGQEHRTGRNYVASWKKVLSLTEFSQIKSAGFLPDINLALSAVYAPDPQNGPFFVDLPFRIQGDTLAPVEPVVSRWHPTPIEMVPDYSRNLKRMSIAFDAGIEDGLTDIPRNVAKLDSALTALGIAHKAEAYHGDHMRGIRGRLESQAFPFFSRILH
ncbi:MAG TPA: alpha/beta hydrolase-fold protein [Gemmatimonadaceae bacterium]|nr:alpha/beta hydrolase-fold protein [Gemmatimonadaceae bacterium]